MFCYCQDESVLRFSYVSEDWIIDSDGKMQKSNTDTKRFTYVLGEGRGCRTAIEQFEQLRESRHTLQDVTRAFSVEALTKDFYNKLYNWYLWAVDINSGVSFPNRTEIDTDDRENINRKIIRLITRMLFVWFIKQKHLVPDKIFDIDYLTKILRNFDPMASDDGYYYNAILQNLFFATLNQEIDKRAFTAEAYQGKSRSYTIKTLYRDSKSQSWFTFPENEKQEKVMQIFKFVPYLNGGLFDCLDEFVFVDGKSVPVTFYDGFSSKDTISFNGHFKYRAFIPNKLFFAKEHREALSSEGERNEITVEGLLNIFKQYNFTIEENSPKDTEISLDPELLGRVFENLLAAYNPETQESARKSTGSFYTPREIVDYMVEETLITYLTETCSQFLTPEEIKHLVRNDNDSFSINQPDTIIRELLNMKILDPACGSGAFPIGFLLKMTEIIERLTPNNFDKFQTKLDIIKNCLYGVDIQPIAMLICKLRFFISLICDSTKDDSKPNFGIIPLPNLETKFVAANTLISADVKKFDNDWTNDNHLDKLKEELLELRKNVFSIRTHQTKINNLEKDADKREEIESYIIEHSTKPDKARIHQLEQYIEKYKAELVLYQGENWVDEWIQPQQDLFEKPKPTLFRHDCNKEKRDEIYKKISDCQVGIEKEQNKKILTGFEAAVKQVTLWNPYDQNAVSPFFDPEWMFGVSNGFDIVIGNPPYIQLQNNCGELAALYENCGYKTFARTGDIYCLFYERGWQLLKPNGHLCYITSNKWMRAGYGEKTREFFAIKTDPQLLVDFAGVKIFESATVDTNILMFAKAENAHKTVCAVKNKQNKDSVKNLSVFVQQQNSVYDFYGSDSWTILSPIEQSIKCKIESVGIPLKDWDINIYRGVLTGYNEAFIISTEKRDEILKNCNTEEERQRTTELMRPIL
ncbi:MAG: Eco57I restriction-modification methylase domain-containing protein, partial [Bacilli bacterium]|nr:Eco57I restriction-modification methylase domain-containing protein [Bacilli bacterium]